MSVDVRHTEHVPEWKIRDVEELVRRINESSVVGLVGLSEIPAKQLQQIRAELRGLVELKMVRNNTAHRAIEKCSDDVKPLADHIEGQTAFVFTEINSFKLCKMLGEGKRPMTIRAGGTAPKDIVIEKGNTSFSPGPVVGQLQNAGIPASIKSGKVVINKTKVVAKEGDVVSSQLAEMLALMEIYPKMVGLDMRAVYEDGLVFRAENLTLDVEGLLSQMSMTASQAVGFATEIGYPTQATIGPLLQRASSRARALAVECAIPIPGVIEALLIKAAADASALAGLAEAPEPVAEEPKPKKEETEEDEKDEETEVAAGLDPLFG
jgi:Ribosomal protein L10